MNNEAEITQYIQNVLQRDPHPGEVDGWQALIDSGSSSLEGVRDLIIDSSEAVNDVYPVILAYQAIYGRLPDAGGLDYWTGVYEANLSLDNPATPTVNEAMVTVLHAFVDPDLTPEFASRYGADPTGDQFVAQAYQNVLNRAPDQAGLNYWQARYAEIEASYANSGMSEHDIDVAVRSQILEQFVDSAEYKDSTADLVDHFLANAADEADGAYSGSLWDLQDHTGQTFILTPDADLGAQAGQPFYGTDGDDTYIAGTVNSGLFSGNTLGTGDSLNGAGGNDTLQIVDNGGIPLMPHIANIENVTVQSLGGFGGGTEVVMTNATGVQEIVNERSVGDVAFDDIQNAVAIGVHGTNSTTIANFHDGVDFGGNMQINVDGAGTGVAGDRAHIFVNTDDTPTTLSIDSSGDASFIRVDVDDYSNSSTNEFETLNITGDADLNLRDSADNEFDQVTTVNVNSTGGVNLDFDSSDVDVTYNGANGSGDDFLSFNNGNDNTIDTGAGDDTVQALGSGDNAINTGAGNDIVQVWGSGDNAVNLGDGDDSVMFGYNATVADSADGGAGTDTIGIEAGTLGGLTATADFAGQISGFEKVYAWNDVDQGDTVTVNLANLDNINYVITDGTDAGVGEVQYFHVHQGDATNGGRYLVGGVEIVIDPTDSQDAIGAKIAAAEASIIAQNPDITSVTYDDSSDYVRVNYSNTAGDVPQVTLANEMQTGADFATPNEATKGIQAVDEVQSISVTTAPTTNGNVTVTLNGVAIPVALIGGETTIETAARITDAINAAAGVDGAAVATGSSIAITFDSAEGNVALPVFADSGTGAAATAADGAIDGNAGTPEVQTVLVNSGATADGVVLVEGIEVALTAGMTVDQVGSAVQGMEAEIIAANPDITNVDYNTATHQLTFTYSADAGDVGNVSIIDSSNVLLDDNYESTQGTNAGSMTLDNMQSGGTLELNGANDGDTHVNLATDGASDSFNIILNDGIGNNDGLVHLNGIETLNVSQLADSTTDLGLAADDATTVTVSGVGGVNFTQDFAHLTSFDASGVTGTGSDGAVTVVTDAHANTSLTGGAGNDSLTGSDDAAHVDTINGGIGDDHLFGRAGADNLSGGDGADHLNGGAGADTLTGGAGNDTFVYTDHADSQGPNTDTITDFTSGSDTIDLSAVATGGSSSYLGEANGYGAVLTSLTADGSTHAVLDTSTSTLYVDVNGDGVLDNNDMAINLTGVTDLTNDGVHHDIALA